MCESVCICVMCVYVCECVCVIKTHIVYGNAIYTDMHPFYIALYSYTNIIYHLYIDYDIGYKVGFQIKNNMNTVYYLSYVIM